MNFETKYILRYGIPGWMYILGIVSYLFFTNTQYIEVLLLKGESISILGFGAILAGIGVPIGYIFHLMSMFFSWIIIKDWNSFFEDEIELDKKIINMKNGDKIRERYRYLLSQVQGLKALLISLIVIILTVVLLMIFYKFECKGIVIIVIVILLTIIVNKNRKYFQSNLDHFLKNIDKFN